MNKLRNEGENTFQQDILQNFDYQHNNDQLHNQYKQRHHLSNKYVLGNGLLLYFALDNNFHLDNAHNEKYHRGYNCLLHKQLDYTLDLNIRIQLGTLNK